METADGRDALASLKTINRVIIREKSDACTNCKYVVLTAGGDQLFHATEEAGIVDKMLAGKTRSFEMDLRDGNNKVVAKYRRPYTVGQDKMDISVHGQVVAIVRKELTFLKPVLTINSSADQPLFRLKGPVSISSSCDFELYSGDKKRVGTISKRWSGQGGPDKDNFVIIFPSDLDVCSKAAIIGTAFLIDFLFYLY